ncbi:DUF6050 family protein [Hespellia stercorisuis]|uniref:Uncharacterized protein n=1 Tax=Hespellia stercorisuis DSM 15480 TaxID=1121950 RepID=A0A1M6TK04_9FIRM|nr:DUF6050 family protein [Hespellia stercorisuis]SHK57291.1 hypothetical protein SAMN02745243_03255 [Hespellia stercorisuis DSM 15480]
MTTLIRKSIIPLAAFLLLTYLGQYIFIVDGQFDWFRACLVYGLPFGITHMLFVIPIGGSVTGSLCLIVVNIIVGAVFGCLIAAFVMIQAVAYLIIVPIQCVLSKN